MIGDADDGVSGVIGHSEPSLSVAAGGESLCNIPSVHSALPKRVYIIFCTDQSS